MADKSKRVIFVTGSLTGGGAERVLSILASQMAELGQAVSVVILRERKRSYELSEKVDCHQIKSNWTHGKIIDRIIQLRQILKKEKNCTVIPFLPIITLYAMIANIGLGHRMIGSERADPRQSIFAKGTSKKDCIGSFLMRRMKLYHFCDYMVFQTPDAQDYYGRYIKRKSCVIPNPINTEKLPQPVSERNKTVVAAGRFTEVKNFPLLLRAFAEFSRTYPEYRLILYGEGALLNQYENLIEELGIRDKVDMPGFADDLPRQIVNAGIYVSASNHEGISNSMLEALGMGIPSVVTDCPVGGARMFVRTDENGVLIQMEDEGALVDAMKKIAGDEGYASAISEAAVKIRDELRADRIAEKWLELI